MQPSAEQVRTEYSARFSRWEQEFSARAADQHRLGSARLWTGLAMAAVAAVAFGPAWISPMWLAVPFAILVMLFGMHPARQRALNRAARLRAYYERGLARLNQKWMGAGATGDRWRPADHVYADDLDLFGRGSVFERLSTARTATGERTLAEWLLTPGDPDVVRARQQSVEELRPRLELREDLAVLGDDIRAALDDRQLATWGTQPQVKFFTGARVIALILALLAAAAGVTWMLGTTSWRPFFYTAVLEILFTAKIRREIEAVTGAVNTPARELRLIALMLERLERETFTSPGLVELQGRLRSASGASATERIRKLERLVEWKDWAHNQIFGVIGAPLLWVPQFAMAIESWRAECGPAIAGWIAAVGEFEALNSLASFACERPEAVFPELIDAAEPRYEATALLHPLIDPKEAIANDVAIGAPDARLWIVSGSNMSGKSTLLRAVGLSVVLTWAGAPVTTGSLRMTRLKLGASLRANDSLADHKSRFFAEIVRLKQVVDAAGAGGHLLFLLDELLSGTNSHDRRIGAGALIQGLLDRGAIGLATTHDLALAEIAEGMGAVARNVHFEDQFEDGKMQWDYTLRPGVVRRGNAIELMRAVGLDV